MSNWRSQQAQKVRDILDGKGFRIGETVDKDDGDVSVIVSWDDSGPLHCRIHFGFDDNEAPYCFYSFCWQGIGGPGTPIMFNDAADTSANRFAYGCIEYRNIINAARKTP